MIKTKTILILGAGASSPYGYPLGSQLKQEVIDELGSEDFQSRAIDELQLTSRYGREGMEELRDALEQSKVLSIDQFFTTQVERRRLIGKMAITRILLEREEDDTLDAINNNWYLELYKILARDVTIKNFGDNNLRIITFNYDRSLEHFLYTRFIGNLGITNRDLIENYFKKLPIIHIHGRLPPLVWENSGGTEYGADKDNVNSASVAKGLQIVGEDNAALASVQDLLEDAINIYFLGFGYHESNLAKLSLWLIKKCPNVSGTCYKESSHNQDAIKSRFNNQIKLVDIDCDIFSFIQKFFTPDRNALMDVKPSAYR